MGQDLRGEVVRAAGGGQDDQLASSVFATAEPTASRRGDGVSDQFASSSTKTGAPVHRRDLYERAIAPIRERAPELIVCLTTSSRVDPDPSARIIGLELDVELRPEMASLTLGSFNFPDSVSSNPPATIVTLLERMADQGVRPEFEIFEPGMVNTLHALAERGLVPDPPVVNVLLGSMGTPPSSATWPTSSSACQPAPSGLRPGSASSSGR